MVSLSVIQNRVFDDLMSMVKNPNFFPAWANTRGLALYSQAQLDRWQTEGASEGRPWQPINSSYFARKQKQFKSFFGQGTKTLIATSRLLASVLPPIYRSGPEATHGEEFRKTVTDTSLEIATAVPYSIFVDEIRPISVWSDEFKAKVRADFKAYLVSGMRGRDK